MDLFYILVLIPLSVNAGYDGPSYRSSVMDGDKPILRGGGPEPEEADISGRALTAEDSSDMKVIPLKINNIEAGDEDEDSEERDQKTARDLSVLVGWLIENYGYAIVKPSRRQQDPSSKPTEAAPFMKARENSKHKQKNKGSKKKGKSSKHKGVKSEPKQKKRSLRMQRLVYPERRDNKNQDNKNEENKNQEIKNQDNKSDPIDDSKITGISISIPISPYFLKISETPNMTVFLGKYTLVQTASIPHNTGTRYGFPVRYNTAVRQDQN
ncbi:uncharacterized protein LOC142983747 isoform X4 [Anticarsia gemmatalis]|uniref:uncharacterized protein LOC142983747 isoform X4 n=1 Tax=Anticarsia gemmatalis TaxID=129554 RepID=UPI003F770602